MIVRSGVVVAPTGRWTVGLEVGTGKELWRYFAPLDVADNRPGYVGTATIGADAELVYIPAWGASISALDLTTGRVQWVWTPGTTAQFASGADGVSASGDTVYATVWHYITALGGKSEHWLVALDRLTGKELWRVVFPSYTFGVIFMGAPVVYRDLVIFHSVGGYEWAVNRFTREIAWRFTPTPQHVSVPQTELFGDVVYHYGADYFVYALRAQDGSMVWRAAVDAPPTGFLLVTERHVYVPAQARFIVLERNSGRRVVAIPQPGNNEGAFNFGAAYSSGRVFVPGKGAAFCFLEPK